MLALADGVVFAIGSVLFIAIVTAALSLGYVRFEELSEEVEEELQREEQGSSP